MTAVLVSIAEAVKEKLKAAELSRKICPERTYADWDLELGDEKLHVDVFAHTTEQEVDIETRGEMALYVPVDIGVRQRFNNAQCEDAGRVRVKEIDELIQLVEEIWWELRPQNLENFTAGEWEETKILVNPSQKKLKENGQFLGIVRVTFKHVKEA